jgi:HAD superfamily hydrolase (TIGR01450 family)
MTSSSGGAVRLDDVRGFVFDVDGTLVHRAGEEVHVIAGAREVLERIRASGRPFAIFTNGSHVAPQAFARGLRDAGLPVDDDQMLTPLRSFLYHLERRHPGAAVRLFGTAPVEQYLAQAGVRLVAPEATQDAEVIFVAHVDEVDLVDLERAARAVMKGGRLLTGSFVPAYAGANGPILSRGAMVTAAIAKASSTRPTIVGKPSKAAVAVVGEQLGLPTEEVAVIGDDLGMDIGLGHLGGSRTVLVRSGISGAIDLARVPEHRRPHAVIAGVAELLDLL